MATAYSPIQQPAGIGDLLTQILGRQVTSGQNTSGGSTGTTNGTSSATTTSTADIAPLLQIFQQASAGMDPAQLSALISSIFTEGAAQVPALTQQYANSSGSRVAGNSGLNLALGDLNRQLSTQAVQQLLQYNQAGQQTAANAASNIAANTRGTTQTGNQSQQQTGTQTQTQTGTQRQSVNPSAASLVGLGGTALNFLDKKGVFDGLFNRNAGATAGAGTSGITAPLTFGGAAPAAPLSFASSAPAASAGFLAAPAAGGMATPSFGAGTAPAIGGSGLFQNYGGNISNGGGITDWAGSALGGFGSGGAAESAANYFGNWGTGALGDFSGIGQTAFDAGSGIGGITDWANTPVSSVVDGGGNFLSSIGDWFSSFFADGGQISTGATPARVRNQNFMGARPGQREQSEAVNYEGYGPVGGAVGSSTPAGISPGASLAGVTPAMMATPAAAGTQAQTITLDQYMAMHAAESARQSAAMAYQQGGGTGGAGGAGDGSAVGGIGGPGPAAGIGTSAVGAIGNALGMPGLGITAAQNNNQAAMQAAITMAMAINPALGFALAAIAQAAPAGGSSSGGSADGGIGGASGGGDAGGVSGDASVGASSSADGGADAGSGASGPGGDAGTGEGGSSSWADGGMIRGAGTGTSDSIKAKSREPGGKQINYSDGEYVIPADVVAQVGKHHFDSLLANFHTAVNR